MAGLASGRFTIAVLPRVSGTFALSGQWWFDGSRAVRDGLLFSTIHVLDRPELVLRVHPGVTIPTGAPVRSTGFTPWATGSIDPWLSADFYKGSTWLVGGSMSVRWPVIEGTDDYRNGPKYTLDFRLSRRTRWGVASGGLAYMRSNPGPAANNATGELFRQVDFALSWLHEVKDRWAVTGHARVPLFHNSFGDPQPYWLALGATVSRVNTPAIPDTGGHQAGDGHDH